MKTITDGSAIFAAREKRMQAEKTGLCTNPKCVRSKPLKEKAEVKEGDKVKANESE